jgi:hypothetical protein
MAMAIRKTTKVVALCLGLLVLAVVVFLRHTPAGCRMLGGRWATVPSTCVTRLCHYAGSCGKWLHPMVPCRAIPAGTGYASLHYLLGDPDEVEGEKYRWYFGKPDPLPAEAVIRAGRLITLSCPPDPLY